MEQQSVYSGQKDEELVKLVQQGDKRAQEHLFNKYKPLVKTRARTYFLIGADTEDIIQEGMIGLYKAMRDFQKNKNASFRAFAELCINRQMITAIKMATRQKHIPLNSYVSLNRPVFEQESEETYMDMLMGGEILNPEALLIGREDKHFMETQIIKMLSDFEKRILLLYLRGKTYYEISCIVEKSEKSIDNALQRVKKKVEKYLNEKKN
ncbi:RNA polymerase sporulation sigma factor SigH [Clostridium sp. MD294]|uniref:RNA polymerase sporulation sigma factor SigH n=1 Tax=Clostridium sp. MD294 TaxID=97138 RepID=UPI0002CC4369|nr:RNA polymerase sporulation sigma factor SigH [Clostridium sp. MD294]NDO46243.1 RNA polymerase sporulation sigma factor SigH [Clostridium sp. MD294]USF30088.1 RNA polymerase sigma-H factor [Clostridium sp. MD294]